ncbi:hypothetical protein AAL_03858 [Moelleriella libera RCEF 2490]|uniref:Uncharacterized protein n=1 Tax=Moelleriella libera RCEF 2490 TaxID=1081109 RepID=A0A168CI25_9HYPO|nr:hypothetical protein AAL_03858 [Moelleriella libera RCEF 2490]
MTARAGGLRELSKWIAPSKSTISSSAPMRRLFTQARPSVNGILQASSGPSWPQRMDRNHGYQANQQERNFGYV